MWPRRYRREISRSWERVRATPSRSLETTAGIVEYAVAGKGQPVLLSHGIMGGHPAGLGMVATYYGDAFAIAPSRFGYFGSELPSGATPATQADVYVELLDGLRVDRAVVIGFSAGGPSAIEFALRHPERVDLLVLASSALPRRPMPWIVRTLMPRAMRMALSGELPFWVFKTLLPGTFQRLLGVPKDFQGSDEHEAILREITESVFPVKPKRSGAVFDAFIGNPHVNDLPLEEIAAPTLVVHAADDSLAPYETARRAVARMPFARFVTVQSGGHEFLGQEAFVRKTVTTYLSELRDREATRA